MMVEVVLVTRDYRVGRVRAQLQTNDVLYESPIEWLGDIPADAETIRAYVTIEQPHGNRAPARVLTGHEWRSLEDQGRLDTYYRCLLEDDGDAAEREVVYAVYEARGGADD